MEIPPLAYIDIHKHQHFMDEEVIAIRNYFPSEKGAIGKQNKWFSIGIHPWHIKDDSEQDVKTLLDQLKINKPFAIGEIGLDKRTATLFELQKEVFIRQLEIAKKLNLPVIIHAVRSFQELLSIKKDIAEEACWIFHGFRKSKALAEELIKNNAYLSFGEALFYDKNLQKVFKACPLDKLFLETDESEHSIQDIYRKAAQLKEVSLEFLKESLFSNFTSILKEHKLVE